MNNIARRSVYRRASFGYIKCVSASHRIPCRLKSLAAICMVVSGLILCAFFCSFCIFCTRSGVLINRLRGGFYAFFMRFLSKCDDSVRVRYAMSMITYIAIYLVLANTRTQSIRVHLDVFYFSKRNKIVGWASICVLIFSRDKYFVFGSWI